MNERRPNRSTDELRTLAAWTLFPLTLGGAIVAALLLLRRGVAPNVAYLGPQTVALIVIVLSERWWTHRREWGHSRGDVGTDAAFALTVFATMSLARMLGVTLAIPLGGWLSERFGTDLWPTAWSLPAQLALALVVGEFFQYWVHRLQHERDWLWRFHAVHHSVPRLYWLNASRFHPVDTLMSDLAWFIPVFALGAGEAVIALWSLVAGVHGLFQHSNIELRLGPLNHVFSMAELHRWHHSRTLDEANANYGQNLILWDTVFGTRFLPADRHPPAEIGLAELPDFPQRYAGLLASPFRWASLHSRAPWSTTPRRPLRESPSRMMTATAQRDEDANARK